MPAILTLFRITAKSVSYAQYDFIWVGIGHEIDVGVLDVIAHTAHKTPTATAEALVNRLQELSVRLDIGFDRLKNITQRAIALQESTLQRNIQGTVNGLKKYITLVEGNLKNFTLQAESKLVRKFRDKENLLNTKSILIKDKLFTVVKYRDKGITDYITNLKSLSEYAFLSKLKINMERIDNLIPLVGRNIKKHAGDLQRNVHGAYNGFDKYYHLALERFEKNMARTDVRFVKCFTDRVNNLEQKAKSVQAGSFKIIANRGRILKERTDLLPLSCYQYEQSAQKVTADNMKRLHNLYQRLIGTKEQSFSLKLNRFQLSRYLKIASDKEKSLTDRIQRLNSLKPENVLKRGYSITRDPFGKVVKSINQIETGQSIVTQYDEGYSESIISRKGA